MLEFSDSLVRGYNINRTMVDISQFPITLAEGLTLIRTLKYGIRNTFAKGVLFIHSYSVNCFFPYLCFLIQCNEYHGKTVSTV